MIPDGTPPHKDIIIPKARMEHLPDGFEETNDFLGDKKDSLRQYRGPNNTHVLEYEDHYKVHWDISDPRSPAGAIVHIFADAPEIGFGLLAGAYAGKKTFDETESVGDAILDALMAAILTYGSVKITKEFFKWLGKIFSKDS